jgi:hypothetical protein
MMSESIFWFLAGIVVAMCGWVVYDYWFKSPRLRLLAGVDFLQVDENLFCRAKVENFGRTVAENCCGFIHLEGENEDILLVEGSLCWSLLGNPHSVSINPGDTASLDICKFDFKKKEFSFPTERGWSYKLLAREAIGVIPIPGSLFIDIPTLRPIIALPQRKMVGTSLTLQEIKSRKWTGWIRVTSSIKGARAKSQITLKHNEDKAWLELLGGG